MIYPDNRATTFHKPEAAIQAVADTIRYMGNSGRGGHETSLRAVRTVYDTGVLASDLFGLENPCRATFTANSAISLNMTIQEPLPPGDHVITTMMEYNSTLHPLYMMRERGVELTVVRVDGRGNIRYEDLGRAIRPNTEGIACIHAPNPVGSVVGIGRVGRICTKASLLFVLDTSQTAEVFDIHMEYVGIDVLCSTGRKSLTEPQGTEGICLRGGVAMRSPMAEGSGTHSYQEFHPGEMPEALEAGTVSDHDIAGLHTALEFIRSTGMETIRCRELMFMRRFYEGVLGIPGVIVYGDFSDMDRHALMVALNIGSYGSREVSDELVTDYGIYTRTGTHCMPLMHRVLGTVGQGVVRFSMLYYSTEKEIDQAAQVARKLAV